MEALADVDVSFQIETYAEVIGDILPMLPLHWRELAVFPDIPLDPDYEFYRKAEAAGLLVIYTVRKGLDLIGYSIFVVKNSHAHYRGHAWAVNDIIWVHPDHRNMGVGSRFVAFWDEDLQKREVDVVHLDTKVHQPALFYLLKNCGYATTSAGMTKRLQRGVPSGP